MTFNSSATTNTNYCLGAEGSKAPERPRSGSLSQRRVTPKRACGSSLKWLGIALLFIGFLGVMGSTAAIVLCGHNWYIIGADILSGAFMFIGGIGFIVHRCRLKPGPGRKAAEPPQYPSVTSKESKPSQAVQVPANTDSETLIKRGLLHLFSGKPVTEAEKCALKEAACVTIAHNYVSGSKLTKAQLEALKESCPNLKCIRTSVGKTCGFSIAKEGLSIFQSFPYLQELHFDSVVDDDDPEEGYDLSFLKDIPNLTKLSLKNCLFKAETLIQAAPALAKLESLDLTKSELTSGQLCELLLHLPNLKSLNLSACAVNQNVMNVINSMKQLEHLDLSFCNMRDEYLSNWQVPASLKVLKLESNCLLTPGFLQSIFQQCRNIKELNLCQTNVNSAVLEAIPNQSIEVLNLSRTDAEDAWLQISISKMPRLQKLELDQAGEITSKGIESLKVLPELRHLSLRHQQKLELKESLFVEWPKLERIRICGIPQAHHFKDKYETKHLQINVT